LTRAEVLLRGGAVLSTPSIRARSTSATLAKIRGV
jgi:hypothetical protein